MNPSEQMDDIAGNTAVIHGLNTLMQDGKVLSRALPAPCTYAGTYVVHCHRLNHEDNGLMATVNVIPEVSTYAVAVPGSPERPATVQVHDGNGDKVIAFVTPFPAFEGTPSMAMADVNGDMILDLIVGTGPGADDQVVLYDGNDSAQGRFTAELARFAPFDAGFQGGGTTPSRIHLVQSSRMLRTLSWAKGSS